MTPDANRAKDARPAAGRFAILALAIVATSVYALPQVLYFFDGRHGAIIQTLDEAPYVARVQEVMNGHWRPVDQYLWESKHNQFLLPYGAELAIGLAAGALRASIDATIIAIRFVAPALLAIGLYRLLWLLTSSVRWSVVGTLVVLLEPGSYFYQPFHYFTSWLGIPPREQLTLLYSRFHNPLVLGLPFVLAAAAVYRAVESADTRQMHVAGFLVGVNFYTQLFYWTYLYAGLALLTLWYWNSSERRSILTIAGLGLAWGSVAIVEQLLKSSALTDPEMFLRGGLLMPTRRPLFLMPKGLLAVALLFALFYRRRDLRRAFLLCLLGGGYLLLNQNVITGLELQNYHFNYANAIIAVAALLVLAQDRLTALSLKTPASNWQRAAHISFAAACVWLVVNAEVLQAQSYSRRMRAANVFDGMYPSNLKQPYEKTLEWISANTETDAVFLADQELSFLIPIYTGGNVFLNPLQNDHIGSFVGDAELFERWMIQFKLAGASDDDVYQRTRYRDGMAFLSWGFGRSEVLQQKYPFTDFRNFNQAIVTDSLARDYVAEYRRFPTAGLAERLGRYRVDYLVTGPDRRFADTSRGYLADRALTEVAELPDEGVTIYRLETHEQSRP